MTQIGGDPAQPGHDDPDRLAEHLAELPDIPTGVLERAVVAVAVTHRLDPRGHCVTCHPPQRLHLPRRRPAGDCHTRRILRAALRDATDPPADRTATSDRPARHCPPESQSLRHP